METLTPQSPILQRVSIVFLMLGVQTRIESILSLFRAESNHSLGVSSSSGASSRCLVPNSFLLLLVRHLLLVAMHLFLIASCYY